MTTGGAVNGNSGMHENLGQLSPVISSVEAKQSRAAGAITARTPAVVLAVVSVATVAVIAAVARVKPPRRSDRIGVPESPSPDAQRRAATQASERRIRDGAVAVSRFPEMLDAAWKVARKCQKGSNRPAPEFWHAVASCLVSIALAEGISVDSLVYAFEQSRYDQQLTRNILRGFWIILIGTLSYVYGRELMLSWVGGLLPWLKVIGIFGLYGAAVKWIINPALEHEHIAKALSYICTGTAGPGDAPELDTLIEDELKKSEETNSCSVRPAADERTLTQ